MIAFVLWLLLRKPAPVEQSIDYGESSGGGSGGSQNSSSTTTLGAGVNQAMSWISALLKLFGGGSGKSSGSSGGGSTDSESEFTGGTPIPFDELGWGPGIGYGGSGEMESIPSLFDVSAGAVTGTPVYDPGFESYNGLGDPNAVSAFYGSGGGGDIGDIGDMGDMGDTGDTGDTVWAGF